MNYSKTIQNNLLCLTFDGDLIGEDYGPELVELANDSISNGTVHCMLNISNIRYINSSGIGVLITLLTKFKNKGGELVLINPSNHVQKLLTMTKLTSIFKIVSTEKEAINSIKQP